LNRISVTEIDVADPAVEHEVAEHQGEPRGHQHRQDHGAGAVAEVDRGDGIGIGAEAEEGGLTEGQDAAEAPDEAEAEGQDAHRREQRVLHQVEDLDLLRHHHDGGDRRGQRRRLCQLGEFLRAHRLRPKKRPEMPWGSTRIRMIAETNSVTSPNTGVVR
jgi:hypothetical protein